VGKVSRRPQIAVIGKGAPDEELSALAEEVGRGIAEDGAVLVCGGMGGVMDAASRGAREAGGDVIGILPTEEPSSANPNVTHVVATGVGHARNLAVVASADAVIAIGGEWGTLAEIGFARRLGRTVAALRSWTVSGSGDLESAPGIEVVADAAAAVELALDASRERQ
jgi:uncharacterized protein (TIGR00725 family)